MESNRVLNFERIESIYPNPLAITSKEHKLYCEKDKLILSLDDQDNKTILISISLDDFSFKAKTYYHSTLEKSNQNKISNSYIHDNKLYQLNLNRSELCLNVHSLSSDTVIKQYKAYKDEEIYFKNSPLIQKYISNQGSSNTELKTSKQIFRKLLTGNIGISVYPNNDILEVKIGGIKDSSDSLAEDMVIAGLLGAIAVPLMTGGKYIAAPNYSMYSYSSYTNSQSAYFTCLFDQHSLEHVEGEPTKNPYDKIQDFMGGIKKSPTSTQTIFRIDDYYVLGYYLQKEKKYVLRKFE